MDAPVKNHGTQLERDKVDLETGKKRDPRQRIQPDERQPLDRPRDRAGRIHNRDRGHQRADKDQRHAFDDPFQRDDVTIIVRIIAETGRHVFSGEQVRDAPKRVKGRTDIYQDLIEHSTLPKVDSFSLSIFLTKHKRRSPSRRGDEGESLHPTRGRAAFVGFLLLLE
ncbi:MAG: hypothetical protein QGM50_12495 [Anaerolineae bacterium]|nr:hypothetical protein [Anaerolineae bacterium]